MARGLPAVSVDYFFMGQDDGRCLPILGVRDHATRAVAAFPVPVKGPVDYAVAALGDFILGTGYRRLLVKSDQEAAILAGTQGKGAPEARGDRVAA
jgi:hypothetical protein